MTHLAFPALTADSALGFLAAIGTLRLVTDELGDRNAQIGWPDGPFGGAVLQSVNYQCLEDLADAIFEVVDQMCRDERLLPGVDGFPPRGDGATRDPTSNLSLSDARGLAASARENATFGEWVQAIVALAPPIDRKSRSVSSLEKSRFLRAGPGTVWVSRVLACTLKLSSRVSLLEAFTEWRRQEGFMGAYLDHRADIEAATGQDPRRTPAKLGVPGATFLALMALPLLPVRTPDPFTSETVGWVASRETPKGFAWPVWELPLQRESIVALLDHPGVEQMARGRSKGGLEGLGLTAVFRSLRMAAGNNDAALAPAQLLWLR